MKHLILLLGIFFLSGTLCAQEFKEEDADTSDVAMTAFSVFYPTASHAIDPRFGPDLDHIAEQLKETTDHVWLYGFTDNVGDDSANQLLSTRRAESVRDYLVTAGVAEDRFSIEALGEDQPKADNSTAQGRSQNRRVEIRIGADAAMVDEPISPGDTTLYAIERADALQALLGMPTETRRVLKPMPSMKTESEVTLKAVKKRILSSNGSTAMLNYNYNSGDAPPARLFFQVIGAESFFDVPVKGATGNSGKLSIPVQFPVQLGKGEVGVAASLLNEKGRLSQPDTTYVRMERVGTGKVQISLSWDTGTDQDLHVLTPSGELIYYDDARSSDGGRLDRDDRDGFGPENIFWLRDAPDGTYYVKVHDYDRTSDENAFVVTINGLGANRQFYGSTREGSMEEVTTFIKKGDRIIWPEGDNQ